MNILKVKNTPEKNKRPQPDFYSVFIIMIVLLVILFIKACDSSGKPEGAIRAESSLAKDDAVFGDQDIKKLIKDELTVMEGIDADNIMVSVENGHVRLSGNVDYLADKKRIATVAEMIRGVILVENNLQVSPGQISDLDIQSDVSLALIKSPLIEMAKVIAVVDEGAVILRGEVDSWPEKITAEQIVEGVKGVRSVVNNIYVEHDATRPTNEIAEDLKAALQLDPGINYDRLRLMVKDSGDVTIEGTVGSISEKKQIESLSRIDGVQTINVEGVKIVPGPQAEVTGN